MKVSFRGIFLIVLGLSGIISEVIGYFYQPCLLAIPLWLSLFVFFIIVGIEDLIKINRGNKFLPESSNSFS